MNNFNGASNQFMNAQPGDRRNYTSRMGQKPMIDSDSKSRNGTSGSRP